MSRPPSNGALAAERVAREVYGRLLSWLAWRTGDLEAAEDALGDALLAALTHWAVNGVPARPESWILTTAKRRLIDHNRHTSLTRTPSVVAALEEFATSNASEANDTSSDRRLGLLFVCAHPEIEPSLRTPLMLQVVLGLSVAEIAPAMLVSPQSLAQRLVRAKRRIREAGLSFAWAESSELPARVTAVLEALYGAFGLGLEAVDGSESRVSNLEDEALYLAELCAIELPQSAEAKGLLALMLYRLARKDAARDENDDFIPLSRQDPERWDRLRIEQAEALLLAAARSRAPGPFQIEAAIQSAHCERLFGRPTPWRAIALLYAGLIRLHPTTGAQIAGAVAQAEAGDVALALSQLKQMETSIQRSFQAWAVAYAHVLSLACDWQAAIAESERALALTTDSRLQRFLQRRLLEFRRSRFEATASTLAAS